MAIIKCKMCGGELNFSEGVTVAMCEYCGSKQTIPNRDNEKKLTLFARADRLRRACEFDKAAGVYESIVAEFPEEAEAYWGLVLCRYGIEYVDDPATGRKVPTCHRSSFDSILEDIDFDQACENSDAIARRLYRDEAKTIEDIRRGILEVCSKEEPYDIFICHKERDENGGRTIDSVIAQDVYGALTEKGYRVFFSRISLEDKLGNEYEPYIFSALNSAKIMLVFGTDYEFFNAVWVKNEWSRFLALIAAGQKKTLIPCYKGVDIYDMPNEFQRLQAQDMGKVGAIQDLLRGIDKIFDKGTAKLKEPAAEHQAGESPGIASLLKRGYIFLQDENWRRAAEYFEKVLDIDPENSDAYVGTICANHRYCKLSDLAQDISFDVSDKDYQKVICYGSQALKAEIESYAAAAQKKRAESQYAQACQKMEQAGCESEYRVAAELFEKLDSYSDAEEKRAECLRLAIEVKELLLSSQYTQACKKMEQADCSSEYRAAAGLFEKLSGYLDAEEKRAECFRLAVAFLKEKRNALAPAAGLIYSKGWRTLGLKSDGTVVTTKVDSQSEYGAFDVRNWKNVVAIICESDPVGLKADGTVVASSRSIDLCNWKDIVAVAAEMHHVVGLKSDGTVVATGWKDNGQCDVGGWQDIVSVACDCGYTVGLKTDGTVVAVGDNRDGQCDVSDWRDIVAVACEAGHTVGLKSNGTVVAVGNNYHGQCNVSGWRDIVTVACKGARTVGLKSDGTVVAVGMNHCGQCNVNGWRDIVAVACGSDHTVGLKLDGTVVAVGWNKQRQCNVSGWRDIVAVACGSGHTVGLKSDGTVVVAGDNREGQCDVQGWKLFNSFDTLAQEREELKAHADAERQHRDELCRRAEEDRQKEISKLKLEYTDLKLELINLKGPFSSSRRRQIQARLVQIEEELKNL